MEPISMLQSLRTPCFILDKNELENSVKGFQKALYNNFSKSIVGYSVKTNSTPYCMKLVGDMGAYAEVVSHDEYELARLCGFSPDKIIYNGPMKSKETFLEAITKGAIINIETKRELAWLKELPLDGFFKVGIRLNINISNISPDDADGQNDNSRFGFSDETFEFKNAINFISSLPNVSLSGLHIHRTAHSRSINFYKNSIRYACETIKKYSMTLDYIDVGGGYFGIFPNKPTYQQYSDAFYCVLSEYGLSQLCVIVEPGNALVASCYSFLSEVIDVKHAEPNRWFVTTDGSRNDIDPFFKKSTYMVDELYFSNDSQVVSEQIITGCTCLEYDRLYTLKEKRLLTVGDRLLYKNVGAYTMCLSPLFIRYIPKIYVIENDEVKLVREKWTAKEYIQKSFI